ncbi:MAG: hypothetical protein R2856_29795 [Caldilineaceae bacterium]
METDKDHWRPNVLNFTKGQLGLNELRGRPITRDIDWGSRSRCPATRQTHLRVVRRRDRLPQRRRGMGSARTTPTPGASGGIATSTPAR